MAKKNTTAAPLEEAVEATPSTATLIQDRESRAPVRPAFADASDQKANQQADSSQNVAPPRGIAVPGNNPRMQFDREQEDRLRAVPAVQGVTGNIPAAQSSFQPSAIAENPVFPNRVIEGAPAAPPDPAIEAAGLEEAIETSEKLLVVRPRSTFDCIIGSRRWYFIKDTPVRVPLSVREVLARGEMIYP